LPLIAAMRKVAERALEHPDEEVRAVAGRLLAKRDRSLVTRRR
jgi:hypothetical protein